MGMPAGKQAVFVTAKKPRRKGRVSVRRNGFTALRDNGPQHESARRGMIPRATGREEPHAH